MIKLSQTSLLLSSLLLINVSQYAYSGGDTLMDIYELAKTNDHQLKSDYAQFLADSEAAAINRSALRPQIAGTAGITYTNADTTGTTPVETDTDDLNYGISLSQAIIDTSAWNTYRQGKAQTQVAEVTYQANKQSLIIRSAQAYFNVLRQIDQLQTNKAEEKAQATLLEQTRQRYEVGLISINDVHETQAAYDSAVASTINTEANVGIQLDSLTVLTGQLHSDIAPLKKGFTAIAPEPLNKQAWVDFALENNFTLKASQLTYEAARLNAKAAKNEHLPTLNGSITYNDNDREIDTEGGITTNSDSNTTAFNLTLNIPLYTGGSLSALGRQAAQNAISAQESFLFTQRSTIQNTRSLYLSVTTAIPQIKARQQAIVSNESALEATKAGYDAGTRDIVDVVNAQRNLFQAQRDYLDTLYDYIINTLLLKEAAGNLQVSDLETLDNSLDKS